MDSSCDLRVRSPQTGAVDSVLVALPQSFEQCPELASSLEKLKVAGIIFLGEEPRNEWAAQTRYVHRHSIV